MVLKKEQVSLLHANKLLASYYVLQLSKILISHNLSYNSWIKIYEYLFLKKTHLERSSITLL